MLVTGGAGFISSNFVRYILEAEQQAEIIVIDALTYTGSLENLKKLHNEFRFNFIHGDICDSELVNRLIAEHSIDTIVYFAAKSHDDRSILAPVPFIQTNIIGTFNLLEAVRKAWDGFFSGKRFHLVSTDEVFGSLQLSDTVFSEMTPYNPRSSYSAFEASSDHLMRACFHTYGLPTSITNCSNNYGPFQFPEKLIPLMIQNAIQGKSLPIYGDGQQIRDWLYVEDHCEAIHLVLKESHPGETYNVGGENQPYNIDLVTQIRTLRSSLMSLIALVTIGGMLWTLRRSALN